MSYREPLKRAKGLGSNKSGGHEWLHSRFLMVLLVPLALWAMCFFYRHGFDDPAMLQIQFARPVVALPMAAFLFVLFMNLKHEMTNVFIDYVHCRNALYGCLIGLNVVMYGGLALSLFALLKVSLIGVWL